MQYVEIKEQEFDDLVNKLDDVEMEKIIIFHRRRCF